MLYGLYISAAGLRVNQAQQEVQTNNLANVQTVGFKLDRVLVEARPAPTDQLNKPRTLIPELSKIGGGVWARRSVTDMKAGPLEQTGAALDIALQTGAMADGLLAVKGPDGNTRWTRDGRLTLGAKGQLVTVAGNVPVLDEKGTPITLDAAAGQITIDTSGKIRQSNSEVAQLKLATFKDPEQLTKIGGGLFAAGQNAGEGEFTGQVMQGYIEGSAVDPTAMLAQMLQTQRAYEANANMIRFQVETLGRAVNDVGRLG